ncbi:hypothetical protein Bhyg_00659 [Pseudolycoriella hygida]|uniref:Uncharacterized protein n=1 Tax=Pseudolycoriella hygida TaxID=35572 RepID=A0A9Q0N7Y4_9DIPT|nr:hypothetical protein Bhyg_00659 [Pseudolycoriella hygida]
MSLFESDKPYGVKNKNLVKITLVQIKTLSRKYVTKGNTSMWSVEYEVSFVSQALSQRTLSRDDPKRNAICTDVAIKIGSSTHRSLQYLFQFFNWVLIIMKHCVRVWTVKVLFELGVVIFQMAFTFILCTGRNSIKFSHVRVKRYEKTERDTSRTIKKLTNLRDLKAKTLHRL